MTKTATPTQPLTPAQVRACADVIPADTIVTVTTALQERFTGRLVSATRGHRDLTVPVDGQIMRTPLPQVTGIDVVEGTR